jgi:hypothetical protein
MTNSIRLRFRALLPLSSIGALISIVLTATTPAMAATAPTPYYTGGCLEHAGHGVPSPAGWPEGAKVMDSNGRTDNAPAIEVGVCENNRGTHSTVYTDFYVNFAPASNCTFYAELWAGNTNLLPGNGLPVGMPCRAGYVFGVQWELVLPGLTTCIPGVHASAYVYIGTAFYRVGDSPWTTYCGFP